MPELPEVETIKRYLEKAIVGKTITGIEILSTPLESRQRPVNIPRFKGGSRLSALAPLETTKSKTKRKDGKEILEQRESLTGLANQYTTHQPWILTGQFPGNPKEVIGAKIIGLERRGKNLIINLSNGKSLLIHLKLTGQLIWVAANSEKLPEKPTRVIISFDKGKLFFNDVRKFGWIKIAQSANLKTQSELAKLGPEPFGKDFTKEYLQQIFQKTNKSVKLVLLDQEKVAGIGNIYANEILFRANIFPEKPAKSLKIEEIKKLRKAILLVLKEGIKYEGSSAADEAYIKPDGSLGSFQKHFKVYQKNGQKCPKCGTIIKRVNLGGRGTFFCSRCQK